MIFASPDFASSLHRWELAEYISEGFVILACAGELIADLAERLGERRRKRLERWSTILLVLALTIGLKCLVRTNELSGSVIGSLGEQAQEADRKAKAAISDSSTALCQAKDALSKAGKAQESLAKAEKEASNAEMAASGSLALARNAKKEADSFEQDIAVARKQAADAESHLAEAAKRATALTTELDRLTTPRSLPRSQQIVSSLKPFSGTEYMFTDVCADTECINLLQDIETVLQLAGWKRIKAPRVFPGLVLWGEQGDLVGISLRPGIKVSVEGEHPSDMEKDEIAKPQYMRAAITLNLALASNVSPRENTPMIVNMAVGTSPVVHISVGRKPLP